MPEHKFETSVRERDSRIERARGKLVTTRDWNVYPWRFRLQERRPQDRKPDYWEGKSLLDIGSGNKFTDPGETFPGAMVYAIDPEFGRRVKGNTAHETRVGVVQEIPFDDNQFDWVLSANVVPEHIPLAEVPRAFSEMIRVMKPDGEIKLNPCGKADVPRELEIELRQAGFEIDFLEIEG